MLWSGPALLLGSFVVRLLAPAPAPGLDLAGLRRPVAWALEPALWAHANDADLVLSAWLVLELLCLLLLWSFFGLAIARLAAADLVRRPEDGPAAAAFARRHWGGLVGARLVLWGGAAAAFAAAAGLAALGRLPGWIGVVLLAIAVVAGVALCLLAALLGSIQLASGFLAEPTVACEDSDAFDAVTRVFTYTAAGLPRVLVVRLLFLGGVLLGSGWRLLRTLAAAGLAIGALHLGAGPRAFGRALAVLGATGTPADAERLGVGPADWVLAGALAAAAGGLAALWLADLVSRVVCARVGAYLVLRSEIEDVPPTSLRTPPRGHGHRTAEEAGFVEVERVGGPASPP